MIPFCKCRISVVILVASGCGYGQSSDADPKLPAPLRAAVAQQPFLADHDLWGEGVRDGRRIDPFAPPESKAVVLIFMSTECPIANRYAPLLNRLHETYQQKNVTFWLVYADPAETPEMIRRHAEDYQHHMPALRDPDHRLVKFCKASRTPEAVVFAPGRKQQYRGRIDDLFTDYGKSRQAASHHDLAEAIDNVLTNRPVSIPVTPAIGCYIPGVEEWAAYLDHWVPVPVHYEFEWNRGFYAPDIGMIIQETTRHRSGGSSFAQK